MISSHISRHQHRKGELQRKKRSSWLQATTRLVLLLIGLTLSLCLYLISFQQWGNVHIWSNNAPPRSFATFSRQLSSHDDIRLWGIARETVRSPSPSPPSSSGSSSCGNGPLQIMILGSPDAKVSLLYELLHLPSHDGTMSRVTRPSLTTMSLWHEVSDLIHDIVSSGSEWCSLTSESLRTWDGLHRSSGSITHSWIPTAVVYGKRVVGLMNDHANEQFARALNNDTTDYVKSPYSPLSSSLHNGAWVVAEPQLSFYLGWWRQFLSPVGISNGVPHGGPVCILLHRAPVTNGYDWILRRGWTVTMRFAVTSCSEVRTIVVNYYALMHDPVSTLSQITYTLNMMAGNVELFIMPSESLIHQTVDQVRDTTGHLSASAAHPTPAPTHVNLSSSEMTNQSSPLSSMNTTSSTINHWSDGCDASILKNCTFQLLSTIGVSINDLTPQVLYIISHTALIST
jgi:hypothetical protein